MSAVPCGPNRAAIDALRDVTLKPRAVVLVDEAERTDARGYGAAHQMTKAAVEDRYAATGDIECPGSEGQAQVTVKNDLIVSAAHVFTGETCADGDTPSDCTFTVRVKGRRRTYAIERVMKSGWPCPPTGDRRSGDDWIVLKLKRPVDARIKPYGIPSSSRLTVSPEQRVVAVAKSSDWPPGNHASALAKLPRHYGDCGTHFVRTIPGGAGSIETDCDLSQGASGGSMLTPGPAPMLIGVLRAEADPKKFGNRCDPAFGRGGHGAYHEHCWTNYAAPVAGALWDAIATAASLAPNLDPAPVPPRPPPRPGGI